MSTLDERLEQLQLSGALTCLVEYVPSCMPYTQPTTMREITQAVVRVLLGLTGHVRETVAARALH